MVEEISKETRLLIAEVDMLYDQVEKQIEYLEKHYRR